MSNKHMADPSEFGAGYRAFWSGLGPGQGRDRTTGWMQAAADAQAEEAERAEERAETDERRFGLF